MNRKIIFYLVFNLFSPEPEKKTCVSPKKNFSNLNDKEFNNLVLGINQEIDFYKSEVTHLQDNFTALKKDYKDDIHELREDLRQSKNKKLNPWVKGLIVVSGGLVLLLIFWLSKFYYQLFS